MARQTLSGMGSITMYKDELLTIVKTNRDKHRATFDQAIVIFRQKAVERLDRLIAELNAGKTPSLYVNLPVPEEHTEDYDRAIAMLERHTEDTKELTEQGYMQLVDDEWGWSDLFASNTASYLSIQ